MDLAPDFDEFFGFVNVHGVEFVVVGACALALHGGRHQVPVLGRDAFLRNKRAAGRPKDIADIDALEQGADADGA